MQGELEDLSFGEAGFGVRVESDGEIGPTGADRVELTVALNPGEGEHPLRRTASGGELSRLMLAIRRALAGVGPVGTYIFDEVDAGIGGGVAAAVGRKLADVADHMIPPRDGGSLPASGGQVEPLPRLPHAERMP